jgi:hypothetical protein
MWDWPPFTGWHAETGTDPDGREGYALFSAPRFFSPHGYRYALRRTWDEALPVMTFVMLNPSKAGARVNDQTILKCCGFAAREGCGSMLAVNLHGLISTDPAALAGAEDPVGGPINDWAITQAIVEARDTGGKVVLAWGANGGRFPQRAGVVQGLVFREGVTPWALGFTASGQPKHPCRLAASAPLLAFPF